MADESTAEILSPSERREAPTPNPETLIDAPELKAFAQEKVSELSRAADVSMLDGDLMGSIEAFDQASISPELEENMSELNVIRSQAKAEIANLVREPEADPERSLEPMVPPGPEIPREQGDLRGLSFKEILERRRDSEIKEMEGNFERFREIADRMTAAKRTEIANEREHLLKDPSIDEAYRSFILKSLDSAERALDHAAEMEQAFRSAQEAENGFVETPIDNSIAENLNAVFVMECAGENGPMRAVYKPSAKESKLTSIAHGIKAETTAAREWLTSMVDRALFDEPVVPTTVFVKGSEGIGSAQQFVESAEIIRNVHQIEDTPGLEKISLLDTGIQTVDRHHKNMVIGGDGRVKAIDNGLTFAARDRNSFSDAALARREDPDGTLESLRASNPDLAVVDHYPMQSFARAVLSAQEGGAVKLSTEIQRQLNRFLASKELQTSLHEAFEVALGAEEAQQQFDQMLSSLTGVATAGTLETYQYPNERRQKEIEKQIAEGPSLSESPPPVQESTAVTPPPAPPSP